MTSAAVARRDAVFQALADPTRRAMLDRLRDGEKSAGELQEPFAISQPAVSQHLRVLGDAGLVRARREGRRRLFRLRVAPLRDVYDWLARYERFWTDKLDALGEYLNDTAPHGKSRKERAR